jgi:hypothetical protein
MADSAHSITNGFYESEAAGDTICGERGNCWFHCKKSIDKRLFRVRDPIKKSFLLSSLVKLQVSPTPNIFKYGVALFILECQDDDDPEVVTFINDFKAEWIDQNWFEGWNYPNNAGSPSTNNGNEGCNGVLKAEDTMRELLPLQTFLLGKNYTTYSKKIKILGFFF